MKPQVLSSGARLNSSIAPISGASVGAGLHASGSGMRRVGSGPAQGKAAAETRAGARKAHIEYWSITVAEQGSIAKKQGPSTQRQAVIWLKV